ncbi:hypothetical protein QBC40DRAFT_258002 [Triangularia verruculosa]|uniref:Uncharacterized protein n=1 Tax=Triangularia verruculosa TaxID=2587418 RepID=A0AAN6XAH8_9PEZI|nr:hypothetical protein QBC40DRAFT_258002 [Triangularia verruculosa]
MFGEPDKRFGPDANDVITYSWLASTLSYISGVNNSTFAEVVPVTRKNIYTKEIGEVAQAEMTKLSLLKAGIVTRAVVQGLEQFQCHTSCLVILHSAAQKILHKHTEWLADMGNAQRCLDVLQHYKSIDPVAERFRIGLLGIYKKLMGFGSTSQTDQVPAPPKLHKSSTSEARVTSTAAEYAGPLRDEHGYLLTTPKNADPNLAKLSASLLHALCLP